MFRDKPVRTGLAFCAVSILGIPMLLIWLAGDPVREMACKIVEDPEFGLHFAVGFSFGVVAAIILVLELFLLILGAAALMKYRLSWRKWSQ